MLLLLLQLLCHLSLLLVGSEAPADMLTLQPVMDPKAPNVCNSDCMVTAGCSRLTISTRLERSSTLSQQQQQASHSRSHKYTLLVCC
jgi:hypothetical protein